jgi:hypothetical protein
MFIRHSICEVKITLTRPSVILSVTFCQQLINLSGFFFKTLYRKRDSRKNLFSGALHTDINHFLYTLSMFLVQTW